MKFLSGVRLLATTCLLTMSAFAWSQQSCDAHHKHQHLYNTNAAYRLSMDRFNERMVQASLSPNSGERVETVYTIPVVVHIMHNGESYGQGTNITDEQVYSAITALNNDFRKVAGTNGNGNGVDVGMQFCLASRNPQGQPTTGINRVNASSVALYSTNGIEGSGNNGADEATLKALSTWPRTSYVNIWVVSEIDNNDAGPGVQGYAYYPFDTPLDGIVLLYNAFGTVGNLKSYTNMNRVLSHEMGHVFNLMHTFENTTACGGETSCTTQGDRVCDTPPTILNSSCSSPACTGTQQVQNYMDYTSQTCQNMFTAGQKTRMRTALETMRTSLMTSLGCMPVFTRDTGISAVIRPSGSSCATSYTPQVTLTNYGSATLTTCTINYNIDGAGSQTFAWTGSLASGSSSTINLPAISAGMGAHTFYAWTSNPNGAADQNGSNDQSTSTFTVAAGASLTLTVVLDYYGSENTWQILDASNNTVAFGGPYADFQQGLSVVESVCVPAGCYSLVFTDAYGDGQSFPSGSFTLRDASNTVLATASNNWGATNSQNFCVTVASSGSAPVASFNVADNVICRNATATFTNTSSNSPTSYAWTFTGGTPSTSTSANPGTITYATAGTYNVALTVTNANGSNTYTCTNCITVITGPTVTLAATNPLCAGNANGSISSTVSGGYTPYTYTWSNNITSANLTGVGAGSYSTTVTNAQGCSTTASATLTAPAAIAISGTVTNALCSNGSGSISVSATGGTGAKTFAWSNGISGATASNLTPGSYTVTATDANGCSANQSFTVTQPVGMTISGTVTNVSCSGGATGGIIINVTGGTGTKTYLWSNGATTANLSNVGVGSYSLTVTDSNGCTASQSFNISSAAGISVSAATTNLTCAGANNGAISLTVTGGTGSKTYAWSTGATSASISNLPAGNYSVTISDAGGCSVSQSYSITAPTAISISGTVTNPLCSGASNGGVVVSATGGNGNKTFAWASGVTGATLSNITAGSYTVTATDASGCSATQTFTVSNPAPLSISGTVSQITCAGLSNGAIALSVAGGTGAKTYSWSHGANTANASALGAGIYTVTVSDVNGCSASQSYTISSPTALAVNAITNNISCAGNTNGTIALVVSGGIGARSYSWSHGSTSANLTNLGAGTYTVNVTDAAGCTATQSFNITAPAAMVVSGVTSNATCFGLSNGFINASVTGGTGNKSYLWSTGSTAANLNAIEAGNYTLTVTDANNCVKIQNFTITQPEAIAANLLKFDPSCGATTGSAQVNPSGGTAPYAVVWSNGSSAYAVNGIIAGNYSVTVSDANSCQISESFAIAASTGLAVALSTQNISCAGAANGASAANVVGGVAPYTYAWSNGVNAAQISNLQPGTYTVNVADANGCSGSAQAIITEPAPLSVSVASGDVTCFGLNNGYAVATTSGGTGTITVVWNNGTEGAFAENLASDVYTAVATDGAGCTASASVGISEPSALSVAVDIVANESCAGHDGIANIIVDGGTPDYTALWSHGMSGLSASDLSAGSYLVTVADNNGCGSDVEFNIVFDCNASIPTTRLVDADCGATNVPMNAIISCIGVSSASAYQWRFANIAGQFLGESTTTGNQFFVSQIPGANFGTSVQVSLRVQLDGAWGAIGEVCSLTIAPEVVSTALVDADCGTTVMEWNRVINATEIPGAVEYQWHFVGQDFDFTSSTTIPSLILTNTMNFIPGQSYLVEVRADLGGGNFTPWGSSCELSFFSAIAVEETKGSDVNMVVYPNPNAGQNIIIEFGNLNEAVVVQHVVLFDAFGRCVEQTNLQTPVKKSFNYTFKNQLAAGVYVLRATVNNSPCEMKLIVQ